MARPAAPDRDLRGTFDPDPHGPPPGGRGGPARARLDRLLVGGGQRALAEAGARPVTPAEDRYAMVAAAPRTGPGLEASRHGDRPRRPHVHRSTPSVSSSTGTPRSRALPGGRVRRRRRAHTWHEEPALRDAGDPGRGGPSGARPRSPPRVADGPVPVAPSDVSSTELRQRLEPGSRRRTVPEAVIRCIHSAVCTLRGDDCAVDSHRVRHATPARVPRSSQTRLTKRPRSSGPGPDAPVGRRIGRGHVEPTPSRATEPADPVTRSVGPLPAEGAARRGRRSQRRRTGPAVPC